MVTQDMFCSENVKSQFTFLLEKKCNKSEQNISLVFCGWMKVFGLKKDKNGRIVIFGWIIPLKVEVGNIVGWASQKAWRENMYTSIQNTAYAGGLFSREIHTSVTFSVSLSDFLFDLW